MSRFLPQQQLLEKEQQLSFTDQQTSTGVGRARAYDAIEFTSDRFQLVGTNSYVLLVCDTSILKERMRKEIGKAFHRLGPRGCH